MSAERPLVYFVTPAWRRLELSEVVFAQRRLCVSYLAERGVEARSVVIADDENLELARAAGFETIERDNRWLGRRFNDGIEHAARQGADRIVPIGSDSFLDPAFLFPLPPRRRIRSSPLYAVAERDRLARCYVRGPGAGPYMIPPDRLPTDLRPSAERRARGIDRSTLAGLRRPLLWEHVELHPYQYVGFRGEPRMNDYERLRDRIGVGEEQDVAEILSEHYPRRLVERALAALPR